jgi:cysteinyl-tRNA synthetase
VGVFDAIREANRLLDADDDAGAMMAAVHEIVDVLGLRSATKGLDDLADAVSDLASGLGLDVDADVERTLDSIVQHRADARANKDFATSDVIRDRFAEIGLAIEDGADGSRWVRR